MDSLPHLHLQAWHISTLTNLPPKPISSLLGRKWKTVTAFSSFSRFVFEGNLFVPGFSLKNSKYPFEGFLVP